jgi:hypothetical protein
LVAVKRVRGMQLMSPAFKRAVKGRAAVVTTVSHTASNTSTRTTKE